ncbi:MAG: ABC transporter ATP-binding protein [Eubacteriales bacterium]
MALIEVNALTKKYGRHTALDNVTFDLQSGRIIGLLGPNGSGKTTLIKLFAGLLKPTQGVITIDGQPIGPDTKKVVSYLPDVSYIADHKKIRHVLAYFEDFYEDFSVETAEKMLRNLGIDSNAKYKTLSKGTKEKVQLILVMSRKAKLYLLDEPIAGVDPASRDYILNTIIQNYNSQASIIISTHLISDIESTLDDVIFINQSHLGLVSTVDDIRSQHGKSVDQYFREVYRC